MVDMDNVVHIHISGPICSGKTTVAVAIEQMLLGHGLECQLTDDDRLEEIEELRKSYSSRLHTLIGHRFFAIDSSGSMNRYEPERPE